MDKTFDAHIANGQIVPDEPLHIPDGARVIVSVLLTEDAERPFADLGKYAIASDDLPRDLAVQHDHYLYGSPKR